MTSNEVGMTTLASVVSPELNTNSLVPELKTTDVKASVTPGTPSTPVYSKNVALIDPHPRSSGVLPTPKCIIPV